MCNGRNTPGRLMYWSFIQKFKRTGGFLTPRGNAGKTLKCLGSLLP